MEIEIATTPNQHLKETGFGGIIACQSILEYLRNMGHDVTIRLCQTEIDLDAIVKRCPNFVILAVKYLEIINGQNIWLADYFERNGMNHTGSLSRNLEFDSNKVAAKEHLSRLGVPTASFFTAYPEEYASAEQTPINFPFFIKPSDAANGNGVDDFSYVDNFPDFQRKVSALFKTYGAPVLVEQYLDGPEYTVSIIQTPGAELIVSAMEILPPKSGNGLRILGAQVKRNDSEELLPINNGTLRTRAMELGVSAFKKLGVRDFGRIDLKSTKAGEMFFMEANLVPGMTRGSSYFPRACEIADGRSYDSVVATMLEGAFSRARHIDSQPKKRMESKC